MIFIHYIVDPGTYDCSHALNDSQSVVFFDQLHGKTDGCKTIVNEFAFDVLRTLIAEDKISFEHVTLVLTQDGKTTNHTFNKFGNLLTEDGTGPYHFQTPSDIFMHRRWMALAAKQRTARLERETRLRAERDSLNLSAMPPALRQAVLVADAEAQHAASLIMDRATEGVDAYAAAVTNTDQKL